MWRGNLGLLKKDIIYFRHRGISCYDEKMIRGNCHIKLFNIMFYYLAMSNRNVFFQVTGLSTINQAHQGRNCNPGNRYVSTDKFR